jgi:hypothetical protein
MIITRVSFTASRCYTLPAVSPTLRRIATRAVLAAGAGAIAIMAVRACEDRGSEEVTIVVDPRPLGGTVRAVRVDVFDRDGARGSTERRYDTAEAPDPVRLRTAPLGAGAEVVIEVEATGGARRVRRPIEAPSGSTVTILLGDLTR